MRLARRPEFVRCYDQGRRAYSRHFVLFILDRQDAAPAWRLGVTVTRKTGNAVIRNRFKRLLREAFRLDQSLIPEGCDMVVVPKRGVTPSRLTLEGIRKELRGLLVTGRTNYHGPS